MHQCYKAKDYVPCNYHHHCNHKAQYNMHFEYMHQCYREKKRQYNHHHCCYTVQATKCAAMQCIQQCCKKNTASATTAATTIANTTTATATTTAITTTRCNLQYVYPVCAPAQQGVTTTSASRVLVLVAGRMNTTSASSDVNHHKCQ